MQEYRFKTWFENITRDKARSFVLDAVGASSSQPEQQSAVMGSLIRHHPDLEKKLAAYSELQPYMSTLIGFIRGNQGKTIQHLVDYIDSLDNPQPVANNVEQPQQVGVPDPIQ